MIRYLRQPPVLQNLAAKSNVTSTVLGTPLSITNARASTSRTTGAVVVTGGVGISGNLNAGNISGTNLSGTITTAYQPNITQVGVQSALTAVDLTVTGNLVIAGTVSTVAAQNSSVNDALIELHTSGSALTIDDGRDIGVAFNYYKSSAGTEQNAYLVWDNATGRLKYVSVGTVSAGGVVSGTAGTLEAGALVLTDGTISTSTTTGALVVAGGLGVSGAAYLANLYTDNIFHANGAPYGAMGATGAQGITGATGPQGATGFGATGFTGSTGATGPQGATGFGVPGITGATGLTGATGIQGLPGATGAQGIPGTAAAVGATGASGIAGVPGSVGPAGATGVQGIAGPVGPQGPAGNQGATGIAGAPGQAGEQGATGLQGPAGTNGVTGATGASGTVGPAGAPGAQGATGLQGPAGTNGVNGATGATGAAGTDGADGATGATGLAGPVGSQGPQGERGATGPAGTNGAVGSTGATGLAGPVGPRGLLGEQGATGTAGPVGPQGDIGATGLAGTIGPVGPQGDRGATGLAGPVGQTGATGAQGSTGPVGPAGAQGNQGATGLAGTAGTPGAQGSTGATGTAGPVGPQGQQGATGSLGATGATGVIGYTGSIGATGFGATGATGPQGDPGGATGATGSTGVRGITGATGLTGPEGATGIRGLTGYTGSFGATGATGPIGYTGSFGATGATGVIPDVILHRIQIANATPSTSTITGALTVSDGVGITGNLNVGGTNSVLGGNVTISGNLTVQGTTLTVNSTQVTYTDSILELHTNSALTPLTTDDGRDVGIRVHYYKGSNKQAFFGWANDTGAFEYYDDGSETNGVFSGSYGVIKGKQFWSTASQGTAPLVVGSTTQVQNLNAEFAGTVTANAQPNINSVGILSNLAVTGNVVAARFYGDGAFLSNLSANSLVGFNSSLINNSNSNVQVYANTINMSAQGTANVAVVANTGITVNGSITTQSIYAGSYYDLTGNTIAALSVDVLERNGTIANGISSVSTLRFDKGSGLDVINLGGGVAKVTASSGFNLDGGTPTSVYGGTIAYDAGGVI